MNDLAELTGRLSDPSWRLAHLYWIVTKGAAEDADGGLVQIFVPNVAQRKLLRRLHFRNLILKARQLGFSTLVCLLWLDTALFSSEPLSCGIIAQDRETAGKLFAKITFAYDRLPQALRAAFPVTRRTSEEIAFGHNGASVRVATSMRGGTMHRLHVSEMGKIGARYPEKAREIVTGSIPAVPESGIVIVESTAEGASGRFYDMVRRAKEVADMGRPLTSRDYRLHFFSWWEAPEYRIDPEGVVITDADRAYFNDLEARLHITLDAGQRAWYAATLGGADFAGERPLMWQEYPSDADEPFRVPREGCYYTVQLSQARQDGRIVKHIPVEPGVPVNSFWDIGANDNTAIWLHQRVGVEERFIGFMKASGEPPAFFARWLLDLGHVYGRHYLPHDAQARRLGTAADRNKSMQEIMQELMPGHRFEIVDRIAYVLDGIQQTRQALASCWFDESKCSEGVRDLDNYRKAWDERRGTWRDQPFHGPESDAADAFRQFAQARASGMLQAGTASGAPRIRRRNTSPWAV